MEKLAKGSTVRSAGAPFAVVDCLLAALDGYGPVHRPSVAVQSRSWYCFLSKQTCQGKKAKVRAGFSGRTFRYPTKREHFLG